MVEDAVHRVLLWEQDATDFVTAGDSMIDVASVRPAFYSWFVVKRCFVVLSVHIKVTRYLKM
jgi:hypothetical protein